MKPNNHRLWPRRRFCQSLLLAGGGLGLWRFLAAEPSASVAEHLTNLKRLEPLFQKKSAPMAGDWLASHQEKGQTFLQYVRSNPNRPTQKHTTIHLQPIGQFDEPQKAAFRKVQTFLELFFGLPVATIPLLSLEGMPAAARRQTPSGEQLLSTHILQNVLKPARPANSVALLALTPNDLWPGEGWNFVFGQASLAERVGLWSTARFGDPTTDPKAFLRRTLQVSIHETGHMFGIKHCIAWECGMNGSNSLHESDRAPLPFCPECEAKLWWACSLNPSQRYGALATFCRTEGLEPEAKAWEQMAKVSLLPATGATGSQSNIPTGQNQRSG